MALGALTWVSPAQGWGRCDSSPAWIPLLARAGGAEMCWEQGRVMHPESRRGEAGSLAVKCAQPLNKKHFILFSNCIISA